MIPIYAIIQNSLLELIAFAFIIPTSLAQDSTTVSFVGTIIRPTCVAEGGGHAHIVQMGSHKVTDIGPKGANVSDFIPLNLKLVDCTPDVGSTINLTFSGQIDSSLSNSYLVDGGAKGIALQ